MPSPELFPNPTVTKVIFQIRFPALFYLETKIGELQLLLLREFPESALQFRRKLVFADAGSAVKPVDLARDQESEMAVKIWQFKSPKGYELNITNDNLSITSDLHKSYDHPQAEHRFRDIIELGVGSFIKVTGLPVINRIGLRYIDECPVASMDNQQYGDYYNTTLPLSRFRLDRATEMQFQAVVSRENCSLRFVETYKLVNGSPSLMLDTDAFLAGIAADQYLNVADKLHETLAQEFRDFVKEPVYGHMRKAKGGA